MQLDKSLQVDRILLNAARTGVSDIHINPGLKPIIRKGGNLQEVETAVFDTEGVEKFIRAIVPDEKLTAFRETGNLDCAISAEDRERKTTYRFRVNLGKSNSGSYATLRVIPNEIRSIKDVGFPNAQVWQDIVKLRRGLVLVTGITGSGKTTTLAALLQEINETRAENIITLEDPIEYVYSPRKSIISQREIGTHLSNFADGVKYALRQDPDVLLVGEVRDRETARHTLEAAETGHLVFATVHTKNASETACRYTELFPAIEQDSVRGTLANNIVYVLSQQLIPPRQSDGKRTLAMEVLNVGAHAGARTHIRKGDYHQIPTVIQTGAKHGMILMDTHIKQLCQTGAIDREEALSYAHNPDTLIKDLGL
ncbi:PilT/PilU family type 4a pilus ATPase [Candidatus Pacearchaeota archaeon]|nr:PilT/PilU family type 4a pilus ATPase [Candidatus Pacearchaeota archaeon]